MAHKMGAGSTKNSRDSQSKRLGVKCSGGQAVKMDLFLSDNVEQNLSLD